MVDKVVEIRALIGPTDEASWIVNLWTQWNNDRRIWLDQRKELKEYLFATDTTTTGNQSLPWKNSTTLPKLTQIRDNLHSNYLSALFPNDKWLQWKAFTKKDASHKKAKTITAYIDNKARMSNLRNEVSKLIYDYIDYGNAFCTVVFEKRYKDDGQALYPGYIGPRIVRISPEDIVFNPLAGDFKYTPKIIRSVKTLGELKKLALTNPDQAFWGKVVEDRERIRHILSGYTTEDMNVAAQYAIDGFGNLMDYYMSDYVEIFEFFGDHHDKLTGKLELDRVITVIDRREVVRDEQIPTYSGVAPFWHVGWRFRPDNLWAMGPLDNLVGMQYRIDHLENAKADAFDLAIHPPLAIIGGVEEFKWGPGAEVHLDEGGSIEEIAKNLNAVITANNEVALLEDKMELYAGAPREAMGIRTPGEKTKFEVQELQNAAGRIFQEKATNFEINLLEPALNGMLETSRRNMDGPDVVSTLDNDLGVEEFMTITVKDITANGVIRPIGARHFAQQAQDLQNVIGIANSPIWPMVQPHTSAVALTNFINDVTNLTGYEVFRENVNIMEQQDTQRLVNQASEDVELEASLPPPPTSGVPA